MIGVSAASPDTVAITDPASGDTASTCRPAFITLHLSNPIDSRLARF
jgi:hypothetical protein